MSTCCPERIENQVALLAHELARLIGLATVPSAPSTYPPALFHVLSVVSISYEIETTQQLHFSAREVSRSSESLHLAPLEKSMLSVGSN